ncbi:PREDICTED: uncharacterized protein LOC108759811 [Trachymyrmex cornetzi]|uniref:uncharacterized protein LOC108759811 n=1 Tax=Trachymyrmex cornetzi TaxID=471704 RepID=UPI00084F7697|nr:PREDICTED: uncharacterized protein LOC108759811 [Trachymyrmex cornetzi]XP_018360952.1 PREDICTED: uncharacterized protein LOC108759811 [Trachymyrmex cornetzi]
MDTNSKCENNKNTKKRLKSQEKSLEDIRLEDNNKIEQLLPWLLKFNKIIRSCTGSRNYEHLERLVFFYTQNILSSVAENTVEFNDKINLIKNHINKMLIFFHMYWLDIKQQNVDYSQYLNKISALLNVYIDMELKTSSHVVKDSSEVAAKILAALYIYLNNSEEHIFRILLRNTHTKKYTKVCNHIFMRSFTNLKTKTTSITDVAYIRYLLAFKIWRKMEETAKKLNLSDQKKRIDELALMLLGPRMPKLQDELLKFVPRPPIQEKNETLWLIESNQFDIKEFHKQFLLFEDKMDNSTGLKCTKTIHADQTCSKSQKHQINSLFRPNNFNGGTSEQKINECLDGLRNNNTLSNNKNNNDKCLETHLQKSESLEENNSHKIIIIDLTGDDKVKRKRTNRNSESSKVKKNKRNKKKHINSSKYSNKLTNSDVKERSNEANKNLKEKYHLESKSVDIKSSNGTENCTSVSSDTCMEFTKEDEKQHSYNLRYLKSPMLDDQNINELKAKVSKKSKLKNCVSSNMTIEDITSSCDNSATQNKDALTSQEESAMETIPLKTCQNNVAGQQNCQFDFKQELPTSTDCAIQTSCPCCNTRHVDHFIMTSLQFITDRSSLITEMIKQNVCQVNKCPKYCTNVIVAKAQGNLHNTFYDNKNDVKLTCDTIKNDCNKYVYLLNHTDKCVTTVHAEKRVQCLDKSDDKCTVSTTFTEDQVVDPPSYSQHVNFGNFVKINDHDSKYSETMIKEQQKESDSFILNDRLHFSNVEVDCNMKKFFPKKEETNEMTNNYIDLEHNFVNDIQSETLLEDVFWQPSEQPEINLTGVLNKSEDTCIVSTTFIEDQIMESSMDSQRVNSDNRRKCVYEDTMKERGKSDCDTLMSSEHTFDTDFFEVDSKEISEVMKTNCINDFDDINVSNFGNFQTLEDLLSNDTTNFLSQEYLF